MAPADRRIAAAAALLAALLFLPFAPFLGLYLDDYSFLRTLEGVDAAGLWRETVRYVPGRNLHVPVFYALLRACGGSVAAMHVAGALFDAANAALVYFVARRLTGLRGVSLAAAAAFVVAPNHGETHFWITLVPQCQVPTFLALAAANLALGPGGLPWAAGAYAAALFTYDQVFFLWPLLLAAAWRTGTEKRPARLAAWAALFLALNVAHLTLRYLSPYASGGRPLIRFGDVAHRAVDAAVSVAKGVLPWPTSSHAAWGWTVPAVLAALACAFWLAARVRAESRAQPDAAAAFARSGWAAAAAAGLAWTALAYLPNLFWFLSPRHSLLPSAGWALALAAAGAAVAARGTRAARAVAAAGIVAFAAAAVSDAHEGTQWVDSARLRADYAAAAARLAPPVDAVFLVGAPRYLRRAPAFNLFHDVVYSAGRALGRPSLETGDYEASPTRRGLVYLNDLSVWPANAFRWIAAESSNVVVYDAASRSFRCADSMAVQEPDGARRTLGLRSNPGCSPFDVLAEVSLASVAVEPPVGKAPEAPVLRRARLRAEGAGSRLSLDWTFGRAADGPTAYVARLEDASGAVRFDTVFPSRGGKRPYPMIWPLVDDLLPGLRPAPGARVHEEFTIRRAPPAPAPGDVLVVEVYRFTAAGAAEFVGSARSPLTP